jgi:hypothetical protein
VRHKHRIVPGHLGGKYEPGNVVELSVMRHAMWHYASWKLWGRKEDWLAWRGLSGYLGKEDIILESSKMGGRKAAEKLNLHPNTIENRKSLGKSNAKKLNSHPNTIASRVEGGRKAGPLNGPKNGKKSAKKVLCVESGTVFSSGMDAMREMGICQSHISACCRGSRKTAGGYHWEFT